MCHSLFNFLLAPHDLRKLIKYEFEPLTFEKIAATFKAFAIACVANGIACSRESRVWAVEPQKLTSGEATKRTGRKQSSFLKASVPFSQVFAVLVFTFGRLPLPRLLSSRRPLLSAFSACALHLYKRENQLGKRLEKSAKRETRSLVFPNFLCALILTMRVASWLRGKYVFVWKKKILFTCGPEKKSRLCACTMQDNWISASHANQNFIISWLAYWIEKFKPLVVKKVNRKKICTHGLSFGPG